MIDLDISMSDISSRLSVKVSTYLFSFNCIDLYKNQNENSGTNLYRDVSCYSLQVFEMAMNKIFQSTHQQLNSQRSQIFKFNSLLKQLI